MTSRAGHAGPHVDRLPRVRDDDPDGFLDDVRDIVAFVAAALVAAGLGVALASALVAVSLALPWPEAMQRPGLRLGVAMTLAAAEVARACARWRRDAGRGRSRQWRRSTGAASASRST